MIQRLTPRAAPNEYSGGTAEDWARPVPTDLPGTFWAPDIPAEQQAVDGVPVVETGVLYGRVHSLTEKDRVRIPDVGDFHVTGVRTPARNPFTLSRPGIVVTLRRVR